MATQSKKPSAPKTPSKAVKKTAKKTAKKAPKAKAEEPEVEVVAEPAEEPEVEVVAEPAEEPVEETADDPEAAETLSAEDELDLERLDISLNTLDDESLRRGLSGITEKQRLELAGLLNLPRATMHLGDALTSLARRKLRGLPVDRQLSVATAITNRCNDATVRALGDRSDDPSRADLEEVLPAVIEEHGIELTRLMVASYAVSDAPCRDAMRSVLDEDERFVMPERADDGDAIDAELPSFGLVARVPHKLADEDPERARLREQRKVQKAERRAAASHERAARASGQAARREALHAAKRASNPR